MFFPKNNSCYSPTVIPQKKNPLRCVAKFLRPICKGHVTSDPALLNITSAFLVKLLEDDSANIFGGSFPRIII